MSHFKTLAATTIATAVLAASALAPAAAVVRETGANATGRCQAALPAFEGAIRKRPLALQNEGTSTAFVTCSFVTDDSNFSTAGGIYIYARSVNGQALSLGCTAVVGYDMQPDVIYRTKTLALTADGVNGELSFLGGVDFAGGLPSNSPISVSCALPPGAALNDLYYIFDDGYADPATPALTSR